MRRKINRRDFLKSISFFPIFSKYFLQVKHIKWDREFGVPGEIVKLVWPKEIKPNVIKIVIINITENKKEEILFDIKDRKNYFNYEIPLLVKRLDDAKFEIYGELLDNSGFSIGYTKIPLRVNIKRFRFGV